MIDRLQKAIWIAFGFSLLGAFSYWRMYGRPSIDNMFYSSHIFLIGLALVFIPLVLLVWGLFKLRGNSYAPIILATLAGIYSLVPTILLQNDSSAENAGWFILLVFPPMWPFMASLVFIGLILNYLGITPLLETLDSYYSFILVVLWIVLGYLLGKYLKGRNKQK